MSSCSGCPYSTQICPSEGPKDADLLIIGESPGRTEVLIEPKRPFCGPSGEVLNETLSKVGIDRSEAFVTNTVACRIPDNDTPSEEAIKACESRRDDLINKVDPNVILSLGSTASKAMLDTEEGIHSLRGKAYRKDGRWIVPTFHPAQCLHAESTWKDFRFDLEKCKNVICNNFDFPDLGPDYKVATNILDLKKFLNYMKNWENKISCDIETTGLDWRAEDILAVGFGMNDLGLILDWREIEHKDKACRMLRWFFKQDIDIIWHNGQFDRKFIDYQLDIEAPIDYDTMVLHHVGIDERSGRDIRSLSKLSKEWLNVDDWEEDFHEEYVKPDDMTMADAPKGKLFRYLSKDVDATYRLFKEFWGEMSNQTKKCYHNLIQPSQETLVQMEQNGLEADTEHLEELDDEYSSEITKLRSKLKTKADELGFDVEEYVENGWAKSEPEEYFNPSSDQQCHYMYYGVMGFNKYQGDYTASADAREHFKENVIGQKADPRKEFIELHDRFKAVSKLYSTYIKGLWKHIDEGRIYTDYLLFGTRSGRLSCLHEKQRLMIKEKGLVPIKDVEVGDKVATRNGFKKIKKKARTGTKTIKELKMYNGVKIKCSSDHQFLDKNLNWKKTEELSKGDILYKQQNDIWDNNRIEGKLFSEEWLEVLGFIVAEGHFQVKNGRPYTLSIAAHEKEYDILERINNLYENTFNYRRDIEDQDGKGIVLRLCNVEANQEIYELLDWELSRNRKLPKFLFQASKSQVCAFLRGYFQGDGTVNKRGRMSAKSASRELLAGIQKVFNYLGIKHRLFVSEDRSGHPTQSTSYKIEVHKRSFNKFTKEIGFLSEEKIERLPDVTNTEHTARQVDIKELFNDDLLRILPKRNDGDRMRWKESLVNHIDDSYARNSKTTNTNVLKNFINWTKDNHYLRTPENLSSIIENDLGQVEISDINEKGEECTYDIAVEGGEYLVDGIVTHNSRNPNFQNIASQEDVKNVVTSGGGKKIMEIDFSQNEVRYLAVASQDPTLKEMFQSGKDFHDQMAEKVFGKDWSKGQRRIVKIIVFSILYGAGPPKIASNINASLNKAKEWIGYVKETMPVAWEYLQQLSTAHEEKDSLDTPFGRKIRFGLVTENNKHKIKKKSMNLPIQGTASDLTLLAANAVNDFLEGLDAQLVNMIHDSVMIEYNPDLEYTLVAQVPPIMESTAEEALDSDIPWVADLELSRLPDAGWGQLREITRERWLSRNG